MSTSVPQKWLTRIVEAEEENFSTLPAQPQPVEHTIEPVYDKHRNYLLPDLDDSSD